MVRTPTERTRDATILNADGPGRWVVALKWATAALLMAALLGLMVLSYHQPLSADDYAGAVGLRQHPALLDSIAHGYGAWSGRATAMGVGWFALKFRLAFAILNGLAFAGVVGLTFTIAVARRPVWRSRDLSLIALITLTYWFALPAIAETVMWRSGSAMYLWPTLLMLAMIEPYRRWLRDDRATLLWAGPLELAWTPALLIFGVITGLSHELVVVALAGLGTALLVFVVRQRRLAQVPLHLWAGALGAAVGGVLLLLAPGNSVRSDAANTGASLLERLASLATYLLKVFGSYLPKLYPWLVCIALLAIPLSLLARSRERGSWPRYWVVWSIAGLVTLAPFVREPAVALVAGQRTTIFVAVLFTIAALSLMGDVGPPRVLDRLPAIAAYATTTILLVVMLAELGGSVQRASRISAEVKARESLVAAQLKAGRTDVVVPPLATKPYRTVYYLDLGPDPAYFVNEALATWYDAKTIRLGPAPAQ